MRSSKMPTSSTESVSERTRRREGQSLPFPVKLGNLDVELLNEPEYDLRLGPLNKNAPGDMKSMLSMEPKLDPEPARDRVLEVLEPVGRFIGRGRTVAEVLWKNEVNTL